MRLILHPAEVGARAVTSRSQAPDGDARAWSRRELWIFAGMSQERGQDADAVLEPYGADAPDPRVLEVSRGIGLDGVYTPTVPGELQLLRSNGEDNRGFALGPKLAFGKERVRRNQGIESLAVLSVSFGGSGFRVPELSARWNPGDALFETARAEALAFLKRRPDHRFMGIVSGLPVADSEPEDFGGPARIRAMRAYADGLRDALPGGASASVLLTQPPRRYIEASRSAAIGDRVQAALAGGELARCLQVPTGDLDSPADDVAHFKGDTLRAFGRRIAEVADAVRERPGAAPPAAYRLRFDRGTAEFRDAFGSPARVLAGRYETDPERGRVLRFNGTGGFDTTLTLGPAAYTKALWVKRARVVQPDEVLIAGNVRDEALARFGGHYFSRRFAGHVPADVAAPIPLRFNSNPVFAPIGRWDHMALTYDGTTGRFASYWNGELIGQGGAGYPVTDEALVVQLGCHGDRRGVRLDDGPPPTYGASPDAWIDDVFVAPIALGDEDVRALFESGRA